jgi:aryl-alcohol dehydrogenase-like predicted oxidoreductase
MNFCKKCNFVLNITKKQLSEDEKNHYKISTIESFLNYMKYNVTEANQILDIKIDRESLKEKLITKFKKTPEKVDELIALSNKVGITLPQLALNWCMFQPNVSTVILGASKETQLKENLKSIETLKKYSTALNEKIEKVLKNKPVLPKF